MAYNNAIPQFVPSATPYGYPQFQNSGLNWVLSENAAKSFPVAPGQTACIFDKERDVFYMKSVDVMGVPTFDTFTYSKVVNTPVEEKPNDVSYVTREDLEAFKNELRNEFKQNTYKPKYPKKED